MFDFALFFVPLVVLELSEGGVDFLGVEHAVERLVREYYFSLFIYNG